MGLTDNKENQAVQLLYACIRGDRASLVKQLEQGSKNYDIVNISREDGWTAIHYASSAGKKEIVEVLALWGANLNCVTALSLSTPLHLAAKRGHLGIVRVLLDLGADPSKIDASGWTAQDIAHACGHDSVAAFLRTKQVSKQHMKVEEIKSTVTLSGVHSIEQTPPAWRSALSELNSNKSMHRRSYPDSVFSNADNEDSSYASSIRDEADGRSRCAHGPGEILRRLSSFREKLEPLWVAAQYSILLDDEEAKIKEHRDPSETSTLRCLNQVAKKLSQHLIEGSRRKSIKPWERCSREFR